MNSKRTMAAHGGSLDGGTGPVQVPGRRGTWRRAIALHTLLVLAVFSGCDTRFGGPGADIATGPPLSRYTLTVSAVAPSASVTIDERGTTNQCPRQGGGPCELRYLGNEILTLRAHPPAGWRFDRWSGCEVSRSPTIVIVMPIHNADCEAHFFAFDDGFDLSVLPQRVVTAPGIQATSQLAIERGTNFAGIAVQFHLVDPPAGITLAAPASGVTSDAAALALDVPNTVVPGHYLLSLRAEARNRLGQDVARTVTLGIDVIDAGDFYLSLDTPTLSISPGTSCALLAGAHRSIGFSDAIDFESAALPQGVSASFNPNPLVGNETQWLISADAQAPFSEHEVAVGGRAGARTRSASLRLAVTAARDSCATGSFAAAPVPQAFSITLSAASLTQPQGEIGAIDITIDRSAGYLDEVRFSAGGAPPGTLVKFDPPTPALGNTKRMIVLTSPTAPLGLFDIDVTATGGGHIRTARLTLQVTSGAQFCPLTVVADTFASAFWSSAPPSSILEVGSRDLARAAKPYLAFDISQIAPPFDKVELVVSLFSNDWAQADPDGTRTVVVRGITDNNDWNPSMLPEAALNWNNAPKNDTNSTHGFLDEGTTPAHSVRTLGFFTVFANHAQGRLYRIDVTDFVRWALERNPAYSAFAARDADGIVTFMMGNNRQTSIGSSDFTVLFSRESASLCGRPHLEVYQ